VQNLVAFPTERDQVGLSVVTKGAAPSHVVNIESLGTSTSLTSPTISLQDFSTQHRVLLRRQSNSRPLGGNGIGHVTCLTAGGSGPITVNFALPPTFTETVTTSLVASAPGGGAVTMRSLLHRNSSRLAGSKVICGGNGRYVQPPRFGHQLRRRNRCHRWKSNSRCKPAVGRSLPGGAATVLTSAGHSLVQAMNSVSDKFFVDTNILPISTRISCASRLNTSSLRRARTRRSGEQTRIDLRRGKTTPRLCSAPNSLDRIFLKHSIRGQQHHFFCHCLND